MALAMVIFYMDVFAPQKGDIGAKKAIFLSKITYKFKKLAWPDPLGIFSRSVVFALVRTDSSVPGLSMP